MAEHDSKSGTPINKAAKKKRCYTVGYCPNGGMKKPAPQLILKGYWLEEIGFLRGHAVNVEIEQGKLIIQLEGE